MVDLLDRKLIFVTGKGGVGKTTIAAALGVLAASKGKRTLLCEMDAKGDLASSFETAPTRFVEREVAPNLWVMSMDTEASLRQYLSLHLKFARAAYIGPVAKMFDFVGLGRAGVREIASVGKLCWEVRERHYDIVVVDTRGQRPHSRPFGRPPGNQSFGPGRAHPPADRLDARDSFETRRLPGSWP